MFENNLWIFQSHLPVLPALYHDEALPAGSLLRSLYDSWQETEREQEEKSQVFFELGRSFEVSAQQEELKLAQKEEGWTVSVLLVLLSRKIAERTPKKILAQSDARKKKKTFTA